MKTIGTIRVLLLLLIALTAGQGAAANTFRSIHASLTSLAQVSESGKPQPVEKLICPAQLGARIEATLSRTQLRRSRWGILIQTSLGSHTLYSRDAQQYFVPASNAKLLTTAAALHQLGSQFRIRTSVYGSSDGSLRVVGRGDPSLTDTQLRELAIQLSRQGIRQVSKLIAEDDYFRGWAVNPTWEWGDVQADYGASVNSLILNQNAVTLTLLPQELGQRLQTVWTDPTEATRWRIENDALTVGSDEPALINVSRDLGEPVLQITGQLSVDSQPEPVGLAVLDPARNFLQHLSRALAAQGITVAQAFVITGSKNETADIRRYTQIPDLIRVHLRPSAFRELAFVESPPLSQLLVETNQNSNNLYAEALLRQLGAGISNTPATTDSTDEVGLRVERTILTQLGVDPAGYVLADGSGLSRHNLVSPEAIAQTLRAMAHSPAAAVYRASLSVAGISGTLQSRFRNTPAQGILQAKTGTLSGTAAISGYLDPPNYEPLVFSIIVNQSDQSAATLRQASDEILLLLTQLHRC
jgi:D-alanyl-D-alanine carboxypeptidase/D-alanyl-D-alanine-endopeptidase (penicillin-binding protein 4)